MKVAALLSTLFFSGLLACGGETNSPPAQKAASSDTSGLPDSSGLVGRDLFVSWCKASKLSVAVDEMGNVFARRPGKMDGAPIIAGSHLDTQPTGGKFDGVYA